MYVDTDDQVSFYRWPFTNFVKPASSTLYYRTTDPQLNRSIESIKAEKSDIQVQLIKCQSELDDLIKTERRLKEKYV